MKDCKAKCEAGLTECKPDTEKTHLHTGKALPEWMYQMRRAHIVRFPACFGDALLGNTTADGLHFRGAAATRALFTDLQKVHGLGASGKRELVVIQGGSQAGM